MYMFFRLRFTDRDISCVQQCFRYTATVLTSTIAFQNERRLKLHSQVGRLDEDSLGLLAKKGILDGHDDCRI